LQLHTWFNPYRVRVPKAKSEAAPNHASVAHAESVRKYGKYQWFDPGDPASEEIFIAVLNDVVKRYDIDGVHIDDYFYPYQEYDRRGRVIDFPDARSWRRYRQNGGTLARADWRRRNVDQLVKELYAGVHSVKPWVKFGISPFGIWRPGNPPSITGYDAYERLYGDSRKWLRNGWVDYYTPQLYWPIADIPHSYTTLLEWWVSQNVKARHMWPGNYTNKVGTGRDEGLRADEILDEIGVTRAQPGATGNVHFSMAAFLTDRDSLNERLATGLYAEPALVPASPWLEKRVPPRPSLRLRPLSPLTLQASIDTLIPRDSTSPSAIAPIVVLLEPGRKSEPTLWTVRALGGDGIWTTTILPGAAREVALPAATRDVVVTVVGRTGIESSAARLTLQDQLMVPAAPGSR
jgi:uncharacterized lipoprotein YddW (UPF0748 family)